MNVTEAPTSTMIDTTTEFGARVARRLREERIIWLVTVRADLTPQASPVWFVWDGETFLIYSQPHAPKVHNIARSPKVALHLHGDVYGNDIVIFSGDARIVPDAPLPTEVPAMAAKYEANDFARNIHGFTTAIRVTPTALRGW